MRAVVEQISKKARPVFRRYGVERAALFGSFSRAQEKKTSDIDLLISMNDGASLLGLIALKQDLEAVLKRPVDLVEYAAIKPELQERILQEELPIYEA